MTDATVTVRPATHDDIPWMLDELREFAAFFAKGIGTSRDLYDRAAWEERLPVLVDGVAFIARCDGERVGMIAGIIVPHIWAPGIRMLTEAFWWVRPEWRGSSAGYRLLKAFDAAGEAEGVDFIGLQLEPHSDVSDASMARLGYRPSERCFLKETRATEVRA